jgi:DnaJ-class molecular chaperone
MKECPECLGTGEVEVDIAVVDYMNGGYIRTEIDICPECDGSGEVEDWDEEDNDEASDD